MNPALRFGRRHALHAVHAGLVFEAGIGALARNLGDHFLVAANLAWGLFHATFLIAYLSWGRFKRRKGWVVKGVVPAVTGALTTFLFCSVAQVFVMTSRMPNGMRASMRLLAALFGEKIPPAGS